MRAKHNWRNQHRCLDTTRGVQSGGGGVDIPGTPHRKPVGETEIMSWLVGKLIGKIESVGKANGLWRNGPPPPPRPAGGRQW